MLEERDETENEYRLRLLFFRRIFENTSYQLTYKGDGLMRVAMVKVLNLVYNCLLKHWRDVIFVIQIRYCSTITPTIMIIFIILKITNSHLKMQ